eukprot:3738636-Prorocentrum_lima.AAC.1
MGGWSDVWSVECDGVWSMECDGGWKCCDVGDPMQEWDEGEAQLMHVLDTVRSFRTFRSMASMSPS